MFFEEENKEIVSKKEMDLKIDTKEVMNMFFKEDTQIALRQEIEHKVEMLRLEKKDFLLSRKGLDPFGQAYLLTKNRNNDPIIVDRAVILENSKKDFPKQEEINKLNKLLEEID